MGCKIMEFEVFREGGYHWIRCIHCARRPNIYDKAVKLDKPEVFGALSDKPETMTHVSRVKCRCGKTVLKVYGTMQMARGFGCTISETDQPHPEAP